MCYWNRTKKIQHTKNPLHSTIDYKILVLTGSEQRRSPKQQHFGMRNDEVSNSVFSHEISKNNNSWQLCVLHFFFFCFIGFKSSSSVLYIKTAFFI